MAHELGKALAAYVYEPKGKSKGGGKRRGRFSSPGGKGKDKGGGTGKGNSGSPKGEGEGIKGKKGKPFVTSNLTPDQLLAWLAPNKQFRDQPQAGWANGSQWKAAGRSQSATAGKMMKLCKWVAAGTPHLCPKGGEACIWSHILIIFNFLFKSY